MRSNDSISSKEIYKYAMNTIHPHMSIRDYGPKCKANKLIEILLYAAAHRSSISRTCQDLQETPTDQAVRDALTSFYPECDSLERELNEVLAHQLPHSLRKRRWCMAIDLTLLPYHGEPEKDEEEVYRSQAKSGTTHFHAYATCYLVHKARRFTIALIRVTKGTKMDVVVKRLLHLSSQVGIRPKLLLLDRGFYSVNVILYLKRAHCPFIIPAVNRGRKPLKSEEPKGMQVFFTQKQSGWFKHTLTNSKKQSTLLQICVHCRNWQGAWNRHGRQALVYTYWGINPKDSAWIFQTYRTRFGIETSYRQMNEARIKTSTRNPVMRLLFFGIAMILRNLWVWLHLMVFASPRQGGRIINLKLLRFKTLLVWIIHRIEQHLGFNDIVCSKTINLT